MKNINEKKVKDLPNMILDKLPVIESMEGIRDAAIVFRDKINLLGDFRIGATGNIASKAPMVDAEGNILATDVFLWGDRDDIWWRRPELALSSPIPRACRYEGEAFWCNKDGIYTRLPNVLLDEIDLSKFSSQVRSKSLICVPVHMPFGQIGAISFSPADREVEDLSQEFEKFAHVLEAMSRAFLTSYVKVTDQRNWIPKDCSLSKREVQCVSWAALGKTDREIATILSRSCATVRFHLHNAAKKLDAVNRSQTVFKASQLGYLGSLAVK